MWVFVHLAYLMILPLLAPWSHSISEIRIPDSPYGLPAQGKSGKATLEIATSQPSSVSFNEASVTHMSSEPPEWSLSLC